MSKLVLFRLQTQADTAIRVLDIAASGARWTACISLYHLSSGSQKYEVSVCTLWSTGNPTGGRKSFGVMSVGWAA
jgi:hypothetical protein